MQLRVRAAGRSDMGQKRESNQDQFLIAELYRGMQVRGSSLGFEPNSRLFGSPQSYLLVVADGMGGHQAGSQASSLAIDFVLNQLLNDMHWYFMDRHDDRRKFIEDMRNLVNSAHQNIVQLSNQQPGLFGMGTTLTLAYLVGAIAFVVHVGDTRCYRFRHGELQLVTKDHTLARQLADRGTIDAADIDRSPWSNVLWNALGANSDSLTVDVYETDIQDGDWLLLCSDGLSKHVTDTEIQAILTAESDPDFVCCELIHLANARGGIDNITVVLAKIEESEVHQPKTTVAMQVALEDVIPNIPAASDFDIDDRTSRALANTTPD